MDMDLIIENEAVLNRLMLHYKNVSIHTKPKPLFWTEQYIFDKEVAKKARNFIKLVNRCVDTTETQGFKVVKLVVAFVHEKTIVKVWAIYFLHQRYSCKI